jgi:hypothetical protein
VDRGATVNRPCLTLTTCFGERQRAVADSVQRPGVLADAMLDLFDTRELATSVMLRYRQFRAEAHTAHDE